ncbi:nicotinate-nucleotide--dimethylbenzimidazole phosphoribosyltransferase [Streptomyces sp. M600PL45_2]|uniref:Nicotinate-nucleotide--dimethylbenzimidazole phosphoribosyltransferase n=2 Tax=Streptomyces marispadix TaxID=2922868 RepID=A0ABS9SSG5_9ACTN|nr:nicotinate-nucleotide--dimethylbenzimidazole phosphoribosyltransferase [Streptomyces marispadix]MCH6159230.1 nicotinate-nucleotide--dimethylbenzimidazole phosphoribosyltransferase [Streptomyces marispadix]
MPPEAQQFSGDPGPNHVPGPHETDGRDSGSIDCGEVREAFAGGRTPAKGTPRAQTPPRRPLHLGPPEPEQSGAVRPLSDRGLGARTSGRARRGKSAAAQESSTKSQQEAPTESTSSRSYAQPSAPPASQPGPQVSEQDSTQGAGQGQGQVQTAAEGQPQAQQRGAADAEAGAAPGADAAAAAAVAVEVTAQHDEFGAQHGAQHGEQYGDQHGGRHGAVPPQDVAATAVDAGYPDHTQVNAETLPGPQLGALPPQNEMWAAQGEPYAGAETDAQPQPEPQSQTAVASGAQTAETMALAGPQLAASVPENAPQPDPASEQPEAAVPVDPAATPEQHAAADATEPQTGAAVADQAAEPTEPRTTQNQAAEPQTAEPQAAAEPQSGGHGEQQGRAAAPRSGGGRRRRRRAKEESGEERTGTGNTWVSSPGSTAVEAIEPQQAGAAKPVEGDTATDTKSGATPAGGAGPAAADTAKIPAQQQGGEEAALGEAAVTAATGGAGEAGPGDQAQADAYNQAQAGAQAPGAVASIPAQQSRHAEAHAAPEQQAETPQRSGKHSRKDGDTAAEGGQEAAAGEGGAAPTPVPAAEGAPAPAEQPVPGDASAPEAPQTVQEKTATTHDAVHASEEAQAATEAPATEGGGATGTPETEEGSPVTDAQLPAPAPEAETVAVAENKTAEETDTAAQSDPGSGNAADDGAKTAAEPEPGVPAEPGASAGPGAAEPGSADAPGAESAPGDAPEPDGESQDPPAEQVATAGGPPAPGYADEEREAVHRLMRERRDIRNGFRPDPIPHEVLLRVLEAAHTAPSVGHSQPWDFVVIRSEETRRAMHELAERQRHAYAESLPKARAKQFKELKIEAILDTPVNIVVTADPTRGGRHTLGRHTQPQMAPYSSALAVENLWLAARAEGLGVGWVSFFDEREMVRALELPEHLEVVAYLCVGYVDEFPPEPELAQAGWSKRRPLSWVVHEESYGRRVLPGAEPQDLLSDTVAAIRPLDAKALGEAWERQKRMTKPSGALGMLEIISAQLCGLSRKCPPPLPEPAAVAIFAGDHGVHAQGVTPWPQEVTAQMVANFLGGGAVCNAFANQVGAEVCVIDVGIAGELPSTPGLLPRKVRAGTADMTQGPAMTREEALRALEVGIETARDLVAAGNKALLTGEMGIANTTASAVLVAACTDADPSEVTGRGTGINDETHARKVEVVRRALEVHQPDPEDPLGMLAAVGGLEHAALVGLILGGASLRTPVILDGVSAGAAALVARRIAPEAMAACIAGHRSSEPGHVAALTKLGLRPLIDLDLRLGEGTGALLSLPMVQSAARAMHEVATFDSAGVTGKS